MADDLVRQHWPHLAALHDTLIELTSGTHTITATSANDSRNGDAERGRQHYLDLQAYMRRTGRTL